ncbi:alternate-type signal peptide domain-containing protein [Rhodococcus sp. 24CO]|uniref:alternate-type signal peptide domain-containing protein n=1 Tax=Rhodococcus sp. 24CO TaxID=3117460 RepID=UPI003D349819
MKKQTKGAIAAAAAVALLLGGAGSLAMWSDSEVVGGGAITAGTLQLAPCAPVAGTGWQSTFPTVKPIADITAWRIVPTEVLTFDCTTSITADGDRLAATIAADASTITAGTTAAPGATANQLKDNITATTVVTVGGTPVTAASPLTEADNGKPVTVKVTLTFADVQLLVAQGASINLSNLAIKLQQQAIPA